MIGKNNLFFLVITLAIFIACQKESVKEEVSVNQKKAFKITIANGGGFTGLYKGYTLHSDGQVVHWQRFGAGQDSVLWTAQGNPEQIHDFRKQLEESVVLNQTFQETGNMTTMVTLELPGTSRTWSWPGTGVNDNTPDVFQKWFPAVEQYCENLKK